MFFYKNIEDNSRTHASVEVEKHKLLSTVTNTDKLLQYIPNGFGNIK